MVLLVVGTAWYADRNHCSFPAGPSFAPLEWTDRLWKRISGQELDCDPWDYVETEPLTGTIVIQKSFNSIGGSESYISVLQPDGTIAAYRYLLFVEEYETIPSYAHTFQDRDLYQLAVERLSPLRDYSLPTELPNGHGRMPQEKRRIDCDYDQRNVTVYWDGKTNRFGDDYSTFTLSFERPCPASSAAYRRVEEIVDAISAQTPPEMHDHWYEIEQQAREATKGAAEG